MTFRTTTLQKLATVGFAAALGVTALAAPVGAQSTDSGAATDATAEVSDRIERACLRIPNLTTRTENLIARISGDAATRGSLLWLDAKIAKAEELGRADVVTVLENRHAVREQSLPILEQRLATLGSLAERCAAAGVEG